ncbi:ABC transporter substrate-binding protein [Brucella pseudogrignonensis]|uniref:ABC transporter substrate-binding protein n=1 Tax=Brucella pseudogrignonensis TaxID=419475 RepID=UPI00190E4EA7|nr:ABC transporter substrate-binding protein [Brucella pseudogrignonensis]MBK0022904.1 ABC transporter substrate-binding protein [Ochrobactrum sp. S45]MBK0044919.1 ABC transporter substrate-binding protein [Ochrobactrum sp. S46]UKK95332.1 ABC transporter substrate-binding protein [Brucella pseudogrignonensis]
MLSRRLFLGGTAALCMSGLARASGENFRTIAALDWASAQNLLALGITPVGMPEIEHYNRVVVEPAIPPQVHELGLRSEPNLELLVSLKPDLLIFGSDLLPMRERLEMIASAFFFDADRSGRSDVLSNGWHAMEKLAARLNRTPAFEAFITSFEQVLSDGQKRLRDYDGRPLFVATVLDGRRMLVFGKNSLFQAVLDRFGIENAWTGFTSRYGHATINVDRLADQPGARLLCVGNSRLVTLDRLASAPVISSLPFVKEHRIALIPDILFYGGLPSAHRFARLAAAALGPE